MNIAYLDPPYSRYFHDLAGRLAAGSGGSVTALLSCPAYKLYTGGDRCEVWRSGDADAEVPLPSEFARAAWARTEAPTFRRAFAHAVAWFKQRFAAERIELCLVFSDARPFSQAARVAAEALGVVCIYFERGAFRNRTASLSSLGLNARFDLAVAQRDEDAVQGLAPEALPPRRPTERWLRLRFLAFMVLNAWACSRDPGLRPMQHKTYHPFNYLRIWLRERVARRQARADRRVRRIAPGATDPVVLLPLQLQTDSQFVLYSPFPHNQGLLDFVVPRITAALPGARGRSPLSTAGLASASAGSNTRSSKSACSSVPRARSSAASAASRGPSSGRWNCTTSKRRHHGRRLAWPSQTSWPARRSASARFSQR